LTGPATPTDPLPLAQALIRSRSVTPADGGAQDVLAAALEPLGFRVWRLPFGTTPNLFARRGEGGPHLCFAGHTDVVPTGDAAAWTADPFGGEVRDGVLLGRGACDMKGAIAAFVAAVADAPPGQGSVSLLITGDEEGPATDGTVRVLAWMQEHRHIPDLCLVGEPTNPQLLGEVIKIGRRGSLNARITVHGVQGHAAYPQKADNTVHRLVRALAALTAAPLDAGSAWFEPSTLQVTSIDVGNPATNVIPAVAAAKLNIRFNDHHSGAALEAWLRATIALYADRFDLVVDISGESFLTTPGPLVERLRAAIGGACGTEPRLDTGGGTSDASRAVLAAFA
jgi:succinyl-diaminopimelate desuccinylase